MNIGGLVVIALGLFIIIVALRGTQTALAPGLFPPPAGALPEKAAGT